MLDIPSFILGTKNSTGGGGDIDQYFNTTIGASSTSLKPSYRYIIKKIPDLTASGDSLKSAFCNYELPIIPNVDASNVYNFQDLFNGIDRYSGPENLDLSGWKFPNHINQHLNFSYAFCNSLSLNGTINLSSMGDMATGVLNFMYTFQNNTNLKKINLSNLVYTGNGNVDVFQMFNNCTSLEEIDMSNFDFVNTSLLNTSYMFTNVPTNCLILVKDQDQVDWFATNFPSLTNVQIKGA